MELETYNSIVGYGTLILQILLILSVFAYIFKKTTWSHTYLTLLHSNVLPILFILALSATLGSLYYSEIIEFEPCKLCWVQRLFLFPQVLLLGFAYYKDDKKIVDYSLLLSLVGLTIALFHYYGQITGLDATDCVINGGVSCNVQYVSYFGYITIPLMSATIFATLSAVALFFKTHKRSIGDIIR